MPFNYAPHPKQVSAHLAFLTGGFKRGVLLMGRQCLAPDTLVRTNLGYKPISEIEVGDLVLSYGKDWEHKKVTDVKHYGVDVEPKPMLTYEVYGEQITSTYDHPFYFNGEYIPVYKLTWGTMAPSEREKLKLLCKQYGAAFDDPSPWREESSRNETRSGRKRVLEDSSGREDGKNAPSSSPDLVGEPRQSSDGEPQERYQDRQPSGKPGVDESSGQYNPQSSDRYGSQQAGGEQWNSYSNGETSVSYPSGHSTPSGDSQGVRGFLVHNPGRTAKKDMVSHIAVSECAETVSIEVEDNHNYAITKNAILVANSGKTYFATNHSWLSAVLSQGRYFVVFKTYKQAHEVVWRQYVPLIPKELIFKKNEQDLLIELNYIKGPVTLPDGTTIEVNHDVTKPRSTIQLLGSDQADSHRGFRANGIIFDEYADQDPNNWDAVYKHFFTTTNGWAIFMGTPRGYNHFYDLIQFAKENDRWFYQEATWRDSPYVSKEFIAEERAEAEKQGKLSTFLQEVELEFRAVQGAVYPDFDRKIHLIKPLDMPTDLTYYGAIDFGWHTTAFLIWGVDKDQTWYLVDEVYGKETTLDDLLPRIKNVIGDKRLVFTVADSQNRDAIELMNAKGISTVGVNKANDVKGYQLGISLITTKLKPRIQLVGKPKPSMFIGSNCKNFIFEFESYRFPEEKPERNASDVPIKENDHGPDAARYLFLHLKFGLANKDDKFPKPTILKETNSYGLL